MGEVYFRDLTHVFLLHENMNFKGSGSAENRIKIKNEDSNVITDRRTQV